MADFFSKFSEAVNAFADVLTEGVDSKKNVAVYKFEDFKYFFAQKQKLEPRIQKCTIAVTKENEFDGVVFPETKYIIRIILLDSENRPIPIAGTSDEFMGDVVIASAIDDKMRDFMGDKTKKTVLRGGNKQC